MNIAVLPARGGSKRIPRKNIKEFCGKPMIAWAIETAKETGLFDHIIISTEDEEISEIARNYGAETPFARPKTLADDYTATVPVIAHAADTCQKMGWEIDYLCCIYPCNPFLQAQDLIDSLETLKEKQSEFIFPVVEYPHPIQRAMRKMENGKMQFLQPENELTRTQDLEPTFHDAGQFYWGTCDAWIAHKAMHKDLGFPIPAWRVVDIDTPEDWMRAELIFQALFQKN